MYGVRRNDLPLYPRLFSMVGGLSFTGDVLLNFGRAPKWNCPLPQTDSASASAVATPSSERLSATSRTEEPTTRSRNRSPSAVPATPAPAPKTDAWEIPAIQCYEPDDGVFYAQMGPTGGKRGYPAITGT